MKKRNRTSINDALERLAPHKTPIYQAAYWEFESLAENGRVFKKCFFAYFDGKKTKRKKERKKEKQ